MTNDQLTRARWASNTERSGLYAREKDGGALLATIVKAPAGFRWRIWEGAYGTEDTMRRAQRAARKALREVGDAAGNH